MDYSKYSKKMLKILKAKYLYLAERGLAELDGEKHDENLKKVDEINKYLC
jgi:hypothetical protein